MVIFAQLLDEQQFENDLSGRSEWNLRKASQNTEMRIEDFLHEERGEQREKPSPPQRNHHTFNNDRHRVKPDEISFPNVQLDPAPTPNAGSMCNRQQSESLHISSCRRTT